MLDSSLIGSPVNAHPNCHDQHASSPNCQHIHLHFNGTRGDTRVKWQMPCLSIFLIIIIVVLVLNCFHHNYELGMDCETIEDELSETHADEINMNRQNYRTKHLLGMESSWTFIKIQIHVAMYGKLCFIDYLLFCINYIKYNSHMNYVKN